MPSDFQFTQSTSFDSLLQTFQSEKILNQKTDKSIEIVDPVKLKDFSFAIFAVLLIMSKRPGLTNVSFINIDNNGTLVIIEPYGHTSAFAKQKGLPWSFMDDPCGVFQKGNRSHAMCDLRSSIHYNLSKFRYYSSFRTIFRYIKIKEILNVIMNTPNKTCDTHANEILDFIKNKIKIDENYGILFGGYPIFSRVPLGLFRNALVGPSGRAEIIENLLSIFDFIITIILAERSKSTVFVSNAMLQTPFKSFEIDSAIIKNSEGNHKLLAIETTSDYHELKHNKNKIINFLSLKSSTSGNFKYVYLTFRTGKMAKMYNINKKALENIAIKHDCKHTGPISWIMEKESDFIFFDLGSYADVEANIRSSWWDIEKLQQIYKHYIDRLCDTVDSL